MTDTPGRREVRARLTADDQQRIAAIADEYGWSGIGITVWALRMELDEEMTVDQAIGLCALVAQLAALPGHDPTVHRSPEGKSYTTVTVPAGAGVPVPTLIPPVPGKATYTLAVPLPPSVPPPPAPLPPRGAL